MKMKGRNGPRGGREDPWYPALMDLPMVVRYMEVYLVISKENNDKKVETSLVELRNSGSRD